jgi:hypothetical protein
MFLLGVAMIAKQHLSGDEKNRKKKRKEKRTRDQFNYIQSPILIIYEFF